MTKKKVGGETKKKVGGEAPKAPKGAEAVVVTFTSKDEGEKSRVFSRAVHGDEFAETAEAFAAKHEGTIAEHDGSEE